MTAVRPLHRTAAVAGAALLGTLALTGCGSSGGSAATPAPTTSASVPAGGGAAGRPGGGRSPGVSGTVAAVQGTTLQVQGSNEQTAVVYTAKTKVTAQVPSTSAALAVGDCVSVRPATTGATASSSPSAANAGTGPLAAGSVTILSTAKGCAAAGGGFPAGGFPGGGFPGGGRARPSGAPNGMPSGAPTGPPPGMPDRGRPGGGFGAIGEVTTLSAGSFTLASALPRFGAAGAAGPATPTASPSSTPVTVTYAGSTTFLTTAAAKATSIKVGSCLRATGTTDDTGTLTATTMTLSTPVDGSCTVGVRGG